MRKTFVTALLVAACGVEQTINDLDGANVTSVVPQLGQHCTCSLDMQFGVSPPKGNTPPDQIVHHIQVFHICSTSPEYSDAFIDDWIENTCKPGIYATGKSGGCYSSTLPACVCDPYALCFR